MAKDKVEIEIEPTISLTGMQKIKGAFKNAFNSENTSVGGAIRNIFGDARAGNAGEAAAGAAGLGARGASGAASMALGSYGAVAGLGAGFIGSAVGKANPEVMRQFEEAISDVTGVIGQTLTPVIQVLTPYIRMWGDLIASILPTQEMMAEVMEPIPELFEAIKAAINPIIPIVRDTLTFALKIAAYAIQKFAEAVSWVVTQLGGSTSNWASSMGASASGASFHGAADLNRSSITGAFGMGGVGGRPEERTASAVETIVNLMKGFETIGNGILEAIKNPGGLLGFN